MSEDGGQAATGEEAARYSGGVGVGPPPDDHVSLEVPARGDIEHRQAFGTRISDPTHDHDDEEIPDRIRSLLTDVEAHSRVMHLHPAAQAAPFGLLILSLAGAITINAEAYEHHQAGPLFIHTIWILFLGVAVWYGWKALQWYKTWLVITPRRMLLVSGWPAQRAVSLPWRRCRDLELNQTPIGKWLGYGTLVAPSLATGHALGVVPYVPDAQRVYRMIWAILEPLKGKSPMPEEVE